MFTQDRQARNVQPLLQQARDYERQQNYDAAERIYQAALKLAPEDPETVKRLGVLYQTEFKFQDSLAFFKKVLGTDPRYPEVNFFEGMSYFGLNDFLNAIESFERELRLPRPHPRCRYYLSLALQSAGRTDEAIAELHRALKANPKDADALYQLARIHKNESLRAIQLLHDLDPDSFQLHALMGEVYADDQRYPDSIREYEAALAKRPDAPGLHYAIGVAYWAQNQLDAAEKEFLLARKENPSDGLINLYLGDIAVRRQQFREALVYLGAADKALPNMAARVHLLFGRSYMGLGEWEKAKTELAIAARADPSDGQPHYLLARVCRELNDLEASRREMGLFEQLSKAQKTNARDQLRFSEQR